MASPLLKSHSQLAAAAALHSVRRADRCPATIHLGKFHDHGLRSGRSKRSGSAKVGAFPSLDVVPLMVTMVEHVDMSRDYVVTKSIWHLSDAALKSVSCLRAWVKSKQDPFYDSETYRSQGGDGTVHWYYDRQEDLEASAREELLREELLEEIEQRVGGLRELEEASKEEQLTK
ncbi:Photosynthetic NDH subunit of subcomplex B 4, chloroplastic [Zea mays]|uniref:Photosynthetic NDH subunit of subcomplex B 4, chloroplastic n=1 Tax=Zea mays TaxID=4577 RepID=A0A3L6EIE1_MAIZE|nr:Photosynthetic NDH subunit of subcomplex B 4, chloroplastic [Zea mays]